MSNIKLYLLSTLILAAPIGGFSLYVYLFVTYVNNNYDAAGVSFFILMTLIAGVASFICFIKEELGDYLEKKGEENDNI